MPQDSQFALETVAEAVQDTIRNRRVKHSYTLVDGAQAGLTVSYWTDEITVTGTVAVVEVGLSSTAFSQVAVTGTEVAVPTTNLTNRKRVTIKALAANGAAVYIGTTGVTATTGYELAAGSSVELAVDATVNLKAIAASGTQRVSVVELA